MLQQFVNLDFSLKCSAHLWSSQTLLEKLLHCKLLTSWFVDRQMYVAVSTPTNALLLVDFEVREAHRSECILRISIYTNLPSHRTIGSL